MARLKPSVLSVAGILILLFTALILLWFNSSTSNQAVSPTSAQVRFEGQYQIADDPMLPIVPGKHIPCTKADVTLVGNFYMYSPEGEFIGPVFANAPIALYMDHIHLSIQEGDGIELSLDCENPQFGASACGQSWATHTFTSDGSQPITIRVHNPHRFGNETAIDSLLSNMAFRISMDFERDILASGDTQRNTGLLLIIASLVLLGTALFSALIHIKHSKLIWLFGLTILFAGVYLIFSAKGIFFWNESVTANTTILGISMIFCLFFASCCICYFLDKGKPVGLCAIALSGAADFCLLLLPMVSDIYFYDTWAIWALLQSLVNAVLLICLILTFAHCRTKRRWLFLVAGIPLLAFPLDVTAIWLGWWQGGMISKHVFTVLFACALVTALMIIPRSINAAAKATELEAKQKAMDAELAQSRIATMMSQIRPHFIYNTLGSIEQLCELDPPKAGELVHNFAKYLRGNFGELDNPRPILMSKEMEHVRHYISIENVRFPDMTFSFEMNSVDFSLPALTIQPIVENALKHGLMKLEKGGSIKVVSYETDTHYCVSVEDNGVGFDTGILLDDREHIGLRNIRGRLEAMVNGTLQIESAPGSGTKVLIKIPKEMSI